MDGFLGFPLLVALFFFVMVFAKVSRCRDAVESARHNPLCAQRISSSLVARLRRTGAAALRLSCESVLLFRLTSYRSGRGDAGPALTPGDPSSSEWADVAAPLFSGYSGHPLCR